jgi:Helix-turn-helix domain
VREVQRDREREVLVLRVGLLAERMLQDRADLAASLHLAYSRGATLRALAAASGMSHEQVRRIVQRRQSIGRPQQPSCHIV